MLPKVILVVMTTFFPIAVGLISYGLLSVMSLGIIAIVSKIIDNVQIEIDGINN